MSSRRYVKHWILCARFTETTKAKLAGIAHSARLPSCGGIVAAGGNRVVDAQSEPKLDDLTLREIDERRTNSNRGLVARFDAGACSERCHLLECGDELRATVRVSAVVERVDADEYFARAHNLCQRERV